MLSKIKVYLGVAAVAVIGFLSAMVAIASNQRDKAKAETKEAKANLDKAVEANETHQKVEEVNHAIEQAKDSVVNTPIDDRRERMRQRAKDYHGDES